MTLLDRLLARKKKSSAQIAKERLQIIVAHESIRQKPNTKGKVDLQELKGKLIQVIADYLNIENEQVEKRIKVELNQDRSILELDVSLSDHTN